MHSFIYSILAFNNLVFTSISETTSYIKIRYIIKPSPLCIA